MAIRDIPIPERMRHLETDRRGYPKFFIGTEGLDGEFSFIVNNQTKTLACATRDLCSLCGSALDPGRWFVGGPGSAFCNGDSPAYFDPPMHFDCMRYALKVCPYLTMPSYRHRVPLEKIAAKIGRAVIDNTVIPDRPPVFVAVQSLGHDCKLIGEAARGFRFFPRLPFLNIEFWRDGERLPAKEGAKIAAEAISILIGRNGHNAELCSCLTAQMSATLCPWSGAPCCPCCPQSFPWKRNGEPPEPCQAWRDWTRQKIFSENKKPMNS